MKSQQKGRGIETDPMILQEQKNSIDSFLMSASEAENEKLAIVCRKSKQPEGKASENIDKQAPKVVVEPVSGGDVAAKKNDSATLHMIPISASMTSKRQKLNISQEDGWVSASGVSNRTNLKTLAQTSDEKFDNAADVQTSLPMLSDFGPTGKKAGAKGITINQENLGGSQAKRSAKALEKQQKVLQNNSCVSNTNQLEKKAAAMKMTSAATAMTIATEKQQPVKRRGGRASKQPPQKLVGCLTEAEI